MPRELTKLGRAYSEIVGIRFTREQLAQLDQRLARLEFPVKRSTFCRTIILRHLAEVVRSSKGVRAAS